MGILTRRQGTKYVITSDRDSHDAPSNRPPRRLADAYRVWTGADWSTSAASALMFDSLDEADDYVRAHYSKVTG